MKTVNVSELKAHLSKYLRMAHKGERITVLDRDEPIAELAPLEKKDLSWRERMAREGRLRLGTQEWKSLKITPVPLPPGELQKIIDEIKEDPTEVHGR